MYAAHLQGDNTQDHETSQGEMEEDMSGTSTPTSASADAITTYQDYLYLMERVHTAANKKLHATVTALNVGYMGLVGAFNPLNDMLPFCAMACLQNTNTYGGIVCSLA